MATKYSYKISSDFGGSVHISQLQAEVDADVTITTACSHVNTDNDDVDVWFVSSISGAEVTALDAVVAAHTPRVTIGAGMYVEDLSLSLTTSLTFIQKLRLSLTNIAAGDYFIKWSLEYGQVENKIGVYRIQLDNTTVLSECSMKHQAGTMVGASGFRKVTLVAGDHDIDVDYSCPDGTVKIQNVVLAVCESL